MFRPYDAVSYDVLSWERVFAAMMRGENPYVVTTHLNWPPFWMQAIFLMGKIAAVCGTSSRNVLLSLLTFADVVILVVLYAYAKKKLVQPRFIIYSQRMTLHLENLMQA